MPDNLALLSKDFLARSGEPNQLACMSKGCCLYFARRGWLGETRSAKVPSMTIIMIVGDGCSSTLRKHAYTPLYLLGIWDPLVRMEFHYILIMKKRKVIEIVIKHGHDATWIHVDKN